MREDMADILVTNVGGSTQQGKRVFCVCCPPLTLDLGLAPQGTLLTDEGLMWELTGNAAFVDSP